MYLEDYAKFVVVDIPFRFGLGRSGDAQLSFQKGDRGEVVRHLSLDSMVHFDRVLIGAIEVPLQQTKYEILLSSFIRMHDKGSKNFHFEY